MTPQQIWLRIGNRFPVRSRRQSLSFHFACVCLSLILAGCGGGQGVTGGTPGLLRAGATPLAEMKLTLHQAEGTALRTVGFAATGMDGTFQLVTNEARGALRLPQGEYRITLESNGSPVNIPAEFTKPESTPLKITWTGREESLVIDTPLSVN